MVQVHHKGQLELGADAIYAGDQDRIAKLFLVDGEHSAKAANLAYHAGSKRPVGQILDALLGPVGAVNINAAVSVCDRFRQCRVRLCKRGHQRV